MKKVLGFICFLFIVGVSNAELRVKTAIKSGITSTQEKVVATTFSEAGSTNLNYYPVSQGSSVQWLCGGLELTATNSAGQPVNAEFKITAGSFTLYRNGTQFVKTNMSIFLPPNGGGTPSIAVYDKAGTRVTSKDYQTIIGSITGSKFVLSEHMFAIGAHPKFPQLENVAGSSYVLGYSLSGEYKAEGASQFIPFSLVPGDHGFPEVVNTYRNYVAVVIGGTPMDQWLNKISQSNTINSSGIRYEYTDSNTESTFPGGHYLVSAETSTDLKTWTPVGVTKINPTTWVSRYYTDNRRFFRSTVGTFSLFSGG